MAALMLFARPLCRCVIFGAARSAKQVDCCLRWRILRMRRPDSELWFLTAVRRVCREHDGALPFVGQVAELLDARGELTES
jgi:hypothetical protein